MTHHDLLIIGTGSGNSLLTPEMEHWDTAIVEEGRFGGTCLNVGCIPTKMKVFPASLVRAVEESRAVDVEAPRASIDWSALHQRVLGRTDDIERAGRGYRHSQERVTVYEGHARFVGPRQVDVGGQVLTADQVVVATGARPRQVEIPGLLGHGPSSGVHTSDSLIRAQQLPHSIAIIGGGYIAAEFAHMLSAAGVGVHWIHRGRGLLERMDESVSVPFTAAQQAWCDVRLRSSVRSAMRNESGDGWRLTVAGTSGDEVLDVEAVLLAVGRVPNTDDLGIQHAGIELHDDGRIVVDDYQRTSCEGVWALGDCCAVHQLKHVANAQARVVGHNLVNPQSLRAFDDGVVPSAVFSYPQIAAVGATRQELRESSRDVVIGVKEYAGTAYGWAMGDAGGTCTVYVDRMTRELVVHTSSGTRPRC